MNPQKQSGQAVIKDILDEIDLLLYNIDLSISWVHQDIYGNEKADKAAKEAARDPQVKSGLCDQWTYEHLPLKSSQKEKIKALAKRNWNTGQMQKLLNSYVTYQKIPSFRLEQSIIGLLLPEAGSAAYLTLWTELPSANASTKGKLSNSICSNVESTKLKEMPYVELLEVVE